MQRSEYNDRIISMTEPDYQAHVAKVSKEFREQASEYRVIDPTMTLIMQGLAVQFDSYLAHIAKRKAQIDNELRIIANAVPIDSEPELTL